MTLKTENEQNMYSVASVLKGLGTWPLERVCLGWKPTHRLCDLGHVTANEDNDSIYFKSILVKLVNIYGMIRTVPGNN